MKPFVCSYYWRGSEFTFDIEAESHEEAVQRLWAIKCTGRVDGEIVARVPLLPAPSRFWRWLKGAAA